MLQFTFLLLFIIIYLLHSRISRLEEEIYELKNRAKRFNSFKEKKAQKTSVPHQSQEVQKSKPSKEPTVNLKRDENKKTIKVTQPSNDTKESLDTQTHKTKAIQEKPIIKQDAQKEAIQSTAQQESKKASIKEAHTKQTKVDKPLVNKPKTQKVPPIEPIKTQQDIKPKSIQKEAKRVADKPPKETLLAKLIKKIQEYFTTGNILVRIGGVILFFGLAFLVKYAASQGMISIELRLISVALLGIGLLILGWRLREREGHYGTILQGLGVAIFYLVVYAAAKLYLLLSLKLAFVLMLFIVIVGSLLAVMQNALPLALFAISGGFIAPILTSSGEGSHVVLFSYYALLNSGIVAIAWYRSWRILNYVGFIFTFVIATAWGVLRYEPEMFGSTQPFLILFFIFFLAISILFTLKKPYTSYGLVDGTLVFELPLVAFALQISLVGEMTYGVLISALVVGSIYLLLAKLLFQYPKMKLLAEAFMALGVVFMTMAIPYAFDDHLGWALWVLEASAIIWIALKQEREYARIFGIFFQLLSLILFVIATSMREVTIPFANAIFLEYTIVTTAVFLSAYLLYYYAHTIKSYQGKAYSWFLPLGFGLWLFAGILEAGRSMEPFGNTMLIYLAIGSSLFAFMATKLNLKVVKAYLQLYFVMGLFFFITLLDHYIDAHPFASWGYMAIGFFFAMHYRLLVQFDKEWSFQHLFHLIALWLLVGILMREMHYWIELMSDNMALQTLFLIALPLALSFYFALRKHFLPATFRTYEENYKTVGKNGLLTMMVVATIPYALQDQLSAALLVVETYAIIWILIKQDRVFALPFAHFLQLIAIALFVITSFTKEAPMGFINEIFLGYIVVTLITFYTAYRKNSFFYLALALALWLIAGILEARRFSEPFGNTMLIYLSIGASLFALVASKLNWYKLIRALEGYLYLGLAVFVTLVYHYINAHPFASWGYIAIGLFFIVHYRLLTHFDSQWSFQKVSHLLGLWLLVGLLMREVQYRIEFISNHFMVHTLAVVLIPSLVVLYFRVCKNFLPSLLKKYQSNYQETGLIGLLGMMVVATLPYALKDQLSSALLAIESLVIIWVVSKPNRESLVPIGYALQIIAIGIFIATSLFREVESGFINEIFFGYMIVITATLTSAYKLISQEDKDNNRVSLIFLILALMMWLLAGLLEARRLIEPLGNTMLIYSAIGAGLFALLSIKLKWHQLKMQLENFFFIGLIFIISLLEHYITTHPFASWGVLALALFFIVHYALLIHFDREWRLQSFLHPLGLWLLVLILTRELYYYVSLFTTNETWKMASLIVIALGFAYCFTLAKSSLPHSLKRYDTNYRIFGVGGLLVMTTLWLLYSFGFSANPYPLPYMVVLNPLDIFELLSVAILSYWLYQNRDKFNKEIKLISLVTIALIFLVLSSTIFARALHHYKAIDYTLPTLWSDIFFQAGLSIIWSILAIIAMLIAKYRSSRFLWISGFGVLMLVIVKLFFIELGNSGTIERIISFI
ncbi:MAG: DUF2339 domain-containing protein, partial [Campylobacterota bacterium]|nr:DUF2339 domain-containing protein [Campylobacterota bacterium]